MLREIHLILTLMLGPPPAPDAGFAWSLVDAGGRARTVAGLTPRAFARDLASPQFRALAGGFGAVAGMVSLVHAPLTRLTVDRLGNVAGGRGVTYVIVAMAILCAACVAMLRTGLPVFFGSDVSKFSSSAAGVMDLGLVDYELGFNVDLLGARGLDKAGRLHVGESAMTHAMVLTAVHVDASDRPIRWRVQNSWGTDVGDKGWFVMSDRWMDEFVYQSVVDPRFLIKEVRDVLKKEPIVLLL
jgi:bleomycin hydrolase